VENSNNTIVVLGGVPEADHRAVPRAACRSEETAKEFEQSEQVNPMRVSVAYRIRPAAKGENGN
jgi:hypothetical protein